MSCWQYSRRDSKSLLNCDKWVRLQLALLPCCFIAASQGARVGAEAIYFHFLPTHALRSLLCYWEGSRMHNTAWQRLAHIRLKAAAYGRADLRANSQGTGLLLVWPTLLMNLFATVGGPVGSGTTSQWGKWTLVYPTEIGRALALTCPAHDLDWLFVLLLTLSE